MYASRAKQSGILTGVIQRGFCLAKQFISACMSNILAFVLLPKVTTAVTVSDDQPRRMGQPASISGVGCMGAFQPDSQPNISGIESEFRGISLGESDQGRKRVPGANFLGF
jgi:hypothetical protein